MFLICYLLVFKFNMGIVGVAYALSFSTGMCFLAILIYCLKSPNVRPVL